MGNQIVIEKIKIEKINKNNFQRIKLTENQ